MLEQIQRLGNAKDGVSGSEWWFVGPCWCADADSVGSLDVRNDDVAIDDVALKCC